MKAENNGRYVGIDTGKRTHETCVIDGDGKITRTGGKTDDKGLDLLERQIDGLVVMIDEEVEKDDNVQTAMTVPGVGPITALSFVAYMGNLSRFDNAHQVSNFIGFVPKVDNSCTIQRSGHITKVGNSLLRSLLVQAAWSAVRSKDGGALRDKYKYMAETRGIVKGKSIVTTARKIGELLYLLLKTKTEYRPQRFISPEQRSLELAREALA